MDLNEPILPARDETPTKYIAFEEKVAIRCMLQYIDFEGLTDGRSIKQILSRIAPRKLVCFTVFKHICHCLLLLTLTLHQFHRLLSMAHPMLLSNYPTHCQVWSILQKMYTLQMLVKCLMYRRSRIFIGSSLPMRWCLLYNFQNSTTTSLLEYLVAFAFRMILPRQRWIFRQAKIKFHLNLLSLLVMCD